MIRHDGSRVILSGDTSIAFMRAVFHQNPDGIQARESYRPMLDRITVERTDQGFSVEIPDLVIPEKPVVIAYECVSGGKKVPSPKMEKKSFLEHTLITDSVSLTGHSSSSGKAVAARQEKVSSVEYTLGTDTVSAAKYVFFSGKAGAARLERVFFLEYTMGMDAVLVTYALPKETELLVGPPGAA